jgi:radical SAM superfamily enzyme YgiQ (UPF0313 family)
VESWGKGEAVTLDEFPPFAAKHWKFGAIEITRGCIYACSFCQTPFLNKARFRHRSPAEVERHVRVFRAAGNRDLRFVSPTSLSYGSPDESVNLDAVDELLGRVRAAMGEDGRVFFGSFPSEVRPEHVTPEAMRVLKKWVDNDNLIIGGQSGSLRMLEATHRGHDVESIERAVHVAVEGGFTPNVDFILGMPGETPEDAALSLALMERLAKAGARVHNHTFMPLPGTPFKNAPAGTVDDVSRQRLEVLQLLYLAVSNIGACLVPLPHDRRVTGGFEICAVDRNGQIPTPGIRAYDLDPLVGQVQCRGAAKTDTGVDVTLATVGLCRHGVHQHNVKGLERVIDGGERLVHRGTGRRAYRTAGG